MEVDTTIFLSFARFVIIFHILLILFQLDLPMTQAVSSYLSDSTFCTLGLTLSQKICVAIGHTSHYWCPKLPASNHTRNEWRRIINPRSKYISVPYVMRCWFSIDVSIRPVKFSVLPQYCILLVMSRVLEWSPPSLLSADFKVTHNKTDANRKTPSARTMLLRRSLRLISSALYLKRSRSIAANEVSPKRILGQAIALNAASVTAASIMHGSV